MSKNLIRTGFLVLALAAALLVSVLLLRLPAVAARASAAQQAVQTEATQPCWRVCVRGTGRAVLYSSQGDWMQNLTFYNGETLTMAMPPGDYYLQREDGTQIGFRLAQNASLRMVGGNGWTDGEILYLENEPGCSIQVVCWLSQAEFESGQYEICWLNLRRGEVVESTALHFVPELAPEDNGYYRSSCSFQGLVPGTYMLERDGQLAATVTVTAEEPEYMVVLGGEK